MPSPCWGPSSRAWFPACCLPCVWPVVPWCVAVFVHCPLCHWLPAYSAHSPDLGAPGAEFWRLSPLLLARSAFFALSLWCSAPPSASCPVAMNCVSLRLNSRCWLRLRTPSRLVSPGLWALLVLVAPLLLPMLVPSAPAVNAASAAPPVVPSPSHEVAASLLRSASLRAASPRTRTRSRSPAPLPKRASRRSSSVASGLRGSVALAESGLVTGLATKSCPPVPPPQLRLSFPRLSRSPRCLSWLAAICRRLRALCTLCPGLRGPSCYGVCVQLR